MSSTKAKALVGIAQLQSKSNKLDNLGAVAECARLAKKVGASMLFLPECFGFIGGSAEQTLKEAETSLDESGATKNHESVTEYLNSILIEKEIQKPNVFTDVSLIDGLRTIARKSGLWISGGGVHVAGAPKDDETGNQRVYNTHVILDKDGVVKAAYHKIHLFDVSIPGKVNLRESATTAPGTKVVVCDSPVGKLGLSTCYDVRFPEMYIDLVNQGAEVILVPAAFTVPTGSAHWHTLLKARAIESQCYILAAAQYGRHNQKRESFGHSLAVNPWGEILADAGGFLDEDPSKITTPSLVSCEIDLELIDTIRQRMPIKMHRSNASFST